MVMAVGLRILCIQKTDPVLVAHMSHGWSFLVKSSGTSNGQYFRNSIWYMNPMYNQAHIFEDKITQHAKKIRVAKKNPQRFAWFALNHPLNNWVYIHNPLTCTL